MNKKMSKRQRDIKTKLMAAICMLLVSSIMMVSTTYAWFTLSTAPEVTGIQTAVGANGNLEMALLPYAAGQGDYDASADYGVTSASGDSIKLPLERNVTWGNLVDVSDNSSYGLNNVTLYPSKLNVETDTADGKTITLISGNPLATPQYGVDGRVSTLEADTITGAYDIVKGQFIENANGVTNAKGVRAIGVSSSLTARALAYRTAVANASSADSRARRAATTSLNNRGAGLADIAIKHALTPTATFTSAEIQPLRDAVSDLQGVMDQIAGALKNYIIANSIANVSDDAYLDIVNDITDAATLAAVKQVEGAVIPASIDAMITNLDAVIAKVNQANSELSALSGDAIAWDYLQTPLNRLLDTTKMTVNGMTMAEIQEDGGKDRLVNNIIGNKFKADLVMTSGAGVYADIADFCGEYSAAITINVTYGGLTDVPVDANMTARPTFSDTFTEVYLVTASKAVAAYTGGDGSAAANPLSQFYGYIIDLAFKTNAANSWLQLQVDAADRIYAEGSSNPDTMGGGANMTFTSASDTFSQTAVRSLMSNIRIVFFDPFSREVIGYARLDATKVTTGTDGSVTMPLMMTTAAGAAIENDTATTQNDSIAIMELSQNTAEVLSVMVYLDGEAMKNADVAADALQSMTGSMNLQFSSSASLKPMEYSDLMSEGTSNVNSISPLNNVSAPAGYKAKAYTDGDKIAFTLTAPTGTSLDGATIKATIATGADTATDPITAIAGTMGTLSGYVVEIPDGVTVDSNTAITITVEGAGTQTPATPTTYNVTVPTGVTGNATATAGSDYTFTVGTGYTLGEVTVGGTDVEPTDNGSGSYTIPAASVTGAIVINVSANNG